MRILTALLIVMGALVGTGRVEARNGPAALPTQPHARSTHLSAASFGHLPLSFESNVGQADSRVAYLVHLGGANLFLTRSGAVFDLTRPEGASTLHADLLHPAAHPKVTHAVVRLLTVGASPRISLSGSGKLLGVVNYFIGNDPKHWHTNISTYRSVVEHSVYPGIDQVWYSRKGQLEYDWLVHPGADPTRIAIKVSGTPGLHLDERGDLVSVAGGIPFIQRAPAVYQWVGRSRHSITSRYLLRRDGLIRVRLGSHDRARTLVIDPTLRYSTFLGGSGGEEGTGIAVDSGGNAYVTGTVENITAGAPGKIPTTPGALQTIYGGGGEDAYVSKLNPGGSALLFSTYLGGSGEDDGKGIAVDRAGNTYVTGRTSGGFPTTSRAIRGTYGGGDHDAFVSKLNPTGSDLFYSTYLGGPGDDGGEGIAVDSTGNAFVAGYTHGGFPATAGAVQTRYGGHSDAFMSKLDPTGSSLLYSSYLGGSGDDEGYSIALDGAGNVYESGITTRRFPTTAGALQRTPGGGYDAFVSKFNPTGSRLLYSTYLGGPDYDVGFGIAADGAGSAYVTGSAAGGFPTTAGAYQKTHGGAYDAFVSKLNPTGSKLLYSTYLGGSGQDNGSGIAVDHAGNAYVAGSAGPNFPTTAAAFQRTQGGEYFDAFVSKLNPTGSKLLYSTYLGGPQNDLGIGIALDRVGNAYVTGRTGGRFPTTAGALRRTNGGRGGTIIFSFAFHGSAKQASEKGADRAVLPEATD